MSNAVVVVVAVVVRFCVLHGAWHQSGGINSGAVDRPSGLAAWDLYLIVPAEQAFEVVAAVVGGHRRCQCCICAFAEEFNGDTIDARLADFGHAVVVGVEPDQVAEAVYGLCSCALVGLRERSASAVADVHALDLSAMVSISSGQFNVCFESVRSPRSGGCDLRGYRVVDRTLWRDRWDTDDAVVDRGCNRLGARPPLDALTSWGSVTAASVYAHNAREGDEITCLDRCFEVGAVDRAVQRGFSDVIGEGDVEERELIAFEQLQLNLGKRGVLVYDEEANSVEAFPVLVGARDRQGRVANSDNSSVGDVGNVGALVERRGFPAIVDLGIDGLAVDHDVGVSPVCAAAGPVHERLYNLGTFRHRNRGSSTAQLRHRVNFGPVGIDPDVSVSDTEVADESASLDKFTFAIDGSRGSGCPNKD